VTWASTSGFSALAAGTYRAAVCDAKYPGNVAAVSVAIAQPKLTAYAANKLPSKPKAGTAIQIKPTSAPKGYKFSSMTVSSSSKSIAEASAGKYVTFKKAGKVKITVTIKFVKGKTTKTVKTTKQMTVVR
jgi:hypothetical protein